MPFVEREKYQISSKCRLLPSNDLFRDQEEHKIHVDINDWKCGYCRKSFRAEKYLDQHFDNRHHNLLNVSDGKCLADLCGALHCDFAPNHQRPNAILQLLQRITTFVRVLQIAVFLSIRALQLAGCMKQASIVYLSTSILSLMLLPVFYLIVCLYQREMRRGSQVLRRIPKIGKKTKSS